MSDEDTAGVRPEGERAAHAAEPPPDDPPIIPRVGSTLEEELDPAVLALLASLGC